MQTRGLAGSRSNQDLAAVEAELPVHQTPELLRRAAAINAGHPLSLADAWIAASAIEQGATLIHKDPQFKVVPVLQELLPGTRR